jgi:glycosyltransferase involved in cell wall biosynthesis
MYLIAISTYEANGYGKEYLKYNLNKIFEQTYKNIELVISDHSENEDIELLVYSYKNRLNIKYIRNREKYGNISNNINNAIDNCSGNYIKILFMDD